MGLLLMLWACTAAGRVEDVVPNGASAAALPDLGPAPELSNETWLNVPAPLRLADLQGQLVAIDMWTFG